MSPVKHLQEKYREHAEKVHRHMLRQPGRRILRSGGNRVWCSCGRNTVTLSASNRGEVCYICKTKGRLRGLHT